MCFFTDGIDAIHVYGGKRVGMPYRSLYSKNISNLFMAGRDISVTHEALGAVRVQTTTGMMGEIVGMAAMLCAKYAGAEYVKQGGGGKESKPAAAATDTDVAAGEITQAFERISTEVHKIIVGQDEVLEQLLIAMFCGGHALVVGVPGLAKTLLISTLFILLAVGPAAVWTSALDAACAGSHHGSMMQEMNDCHMASCCVVSASVPLMIRRWSTWTGSRPSPARGIMRWTSCYYRWKAH